MSDLGMGGSGRNGAARPMSDIGMPSSEGALTGQKMTPLTGPFGQSGDMHEDRKQQAPEAQTPVEGEEPQQVEGEPEPEPQQDGVLTPEQQIAKYNEWMDSDQIPEEFLDRPIW